MIRGDGRGAAPMIYYGGVEAPEGGSDRGSECVSALGRRGLLFDRDRGEILKIWNTPSGDT